MKKFAFGLQKILDLRDFYKRQAELDLARAIAESDRIKLRLKQNAQNRVSANLSRSGATLQDLVIIENYITRLDEHSETLLQEAAEAELVIEQKRAILAEKLKESKTLEKLKERHGAEYHKEILHADDVTLDDLVNSRNKD